MIKIEITDPHLLDKKVLEETGAYLIALSGGNIIRRNNDEELIQAMRERPEVLFNNLPPKCEDKNEPGYRVEQERSVEEQLDMQQLAEHDGLDIEEELIPVPVASEVFNPVNALPLPPGYAPPKAGLDIHGLPWDVRIHARTKTKMKDGSWKKLRGASPTIVKQVEAQLLSVQNIPAPAFVPVAPGVIPPVPVSVPGFTDLMSLVTKAITEGKLKRDQVTECLKPFGIPSLPLASTRLDLIPAIMLSINEVINAPC